MRKIRLVGAAALAVAVLSSQASVLCPVDSRRSLALNMALALGLTDETGPLRDVRRDELPESLRELPDNRLDKTVAAGAAGDELAGVDLDAIAGLAVVQSPPEPGQRPHPAASRHFIAFVPKRQAVDRKAAAALYQSAMEQAFARVLGATYRVEHRGAQRKSLFSSATKEYLVLSGGPVCGAIIGCILRVHVENVATEAEFAPYGGVPYDRSGYFVWGSWTWDDKGYGTGRGATVTIVGTELGRPENPLSSDELKRLGAVPPKLAREDLKRATRLLPPWAFIYEPPSETVRRPAFFVGGHERLFIAPATRLP